MIRLYPEIFWTGATLAINSSMLVNLMGDAVKHDGGDEHKQFFLPLMAMIAFGVGEMAGSIFEGYLVDKYGNQRSVLGILGIIFVAGCLTLWFNEAHTWSPLAYFMCFFWGCNDGAISTHVGNLLGFEFPDNDTPFSVLNIT
jgi:MFS family permease